LNINKYKILFFTTLIAIFILSIIPHPNNEYIQEDTSINNILSLFGKLAYIGEEFIGVFSDKYRHFIAFWVLGFLLDLSYFFNSAKKIFLLLFYGIFIEFVQYYIPYREFDIFDILFNVFFIILYFLSSRVIFNKLHKKILQFLISKENINVTHKN
jgi:VanZ family protein